MDATTEPRTAAAAAAAAAAFPWSRLGFDLTEQILSRLPLRSMATAAAVCTHWRAILAQPSFPGTAAATRRHPWFFIYGKHNLLLNRNQAFAFDPETDHWILLPPAQFPDHDLLAGHGGFSFAATPSPTRLSFAPLLRAAWRLTPPLHSSRCNPLVAAFGGGAAGAAPRFLVAGGARYVGGMVDIEDRLAVEIYDPAADADAWSLGPPLPAEFRSGNSSQWLSSAIVANVFYVAGIFSGAVAGFDLDRRAWTPVRSLRPPGVLFAYLIAGGGDRLVLAGLCTGAGRPTRFALWGVDRRTLELAEMGAMPRELMACLFDSDDDDRFACLKCVGLDGRVYVFNEDYHKGYPACMCEISGGGECTWRKVPPLPGRINQFHKVVAFCSDVPLLSVLAP